MKDIFAFMEGDGSVRVENEPVSYSGEHNAARLVIELNEKMAGLEADYLVLCFDVLGLNRKILSNHIKGVQGESPAFRLQNKIYCPLPEALTSTGRLLVQLEGHKSNGTEPVKILKSQVFELSFEPSIEGMSEALEEACGFLPVLQTTLERIWALDEVLGGLENLYGSKRLPLAAGKGHCSSVMNDIEDRLYANEATGAYAHAEGSYSRALGDYSHAQNVRNTASAYGASALGYTTIASAPYSTIVGCYGQTNSDSLFCVANGGEGVSNSLALDVAKNEIRTNVPIITLTPEQSDSSQRAATTSFVHEAVNGAKPKRVKYTTQTGLQLKRDIVRSPTVVEFNIVDLETQNPIPPDAYIQDIIVEDQMYKIDFKYFMSGFASSEFYVTNYRPPGDGAGCTTVAVAMFSSSMKAQEFLQTFLELVSFGDITGFYVQYV